MESSTQKKYCIAVDGSDNSDWAFDLVLNELYQKGDKVVIVHIANPNKSDVPFAFQANSIVSKYEARLTGKLLKQDYLMIKQDKANNNNHALHQVNQIAVTNNCTVLVLGFHGYKKNKQPNEVSKGISFIMSNIKLPTIIVKENSSRKNKNSSSFTWLTSIEQANTRSFKAFQFAVHYINPQVDKVVGCHIKLYNSSVDSEVKDLFESFCQSQSVANYDFKYLENDRSNVGNQISNFVNFNETDSIDFVVLGHNPNKYSGGDNGSSPLTEVIKSAKANILFYC